MIFASIFSNYTLSSLQRRCTKFATATETALQKTPQQMTLISDFNAATAESNLFKQQWRRCSSSSNNNDIIRFRRRRYSCLLYSKRNACPTSPLPAAILKAEHPRDASSSSSSREAGKQLLYCSRAIFPLSQFGMYHSTLVLYSPPAIYHLFCLSLPVCHLLF